MEQIVRFLWRVFGNTCPTQQIKVNLHSDRTEGRTALILTYNLVQRGQKLFSVNCYFLCLRNVLRIWNLVCFACKYKASLYYLEYLFEVSAPPAPPRARQRTGESQPGLKTLFWWEISRENKRIHCVFCICIVLTVRSQWFQMAYYTNSSNY